MAGNVGCVLSLLFSSSDQERSSVQKYLVAFLLFTKCGKLLQELKEVDKDLLNLNLTALKKGTPSVRSQATGSDSNDKPAESLLPGLYDDVTLQCLAMASRSDYFSLPFINKRFNHLSRSGILYKLRRQMGKVEHWVFLACSLMPWEAYDPFRGRWMRLPRMPCDECFMCADKESLAVGPQLLVFGREISGFAILRYSLLTYNWSRCPMMNIPRCLFASSSCGEIAIVAGGSDLTGHVLKFAEMYNQELGTWEILPDMNIARRLCSGFFMDGKFYVIGGMISHTQSESSGEEFNLQTRTWRIIPNMYPGGNGATHSPPLVAVVNNQLYAADQSTNVVKKYDKINNSWHVVKRLPVRADSSNGWGLAFRACGNLLLVIGGQRGPRGEVVMLHCWCPEDGNPRADWDVLAVRERAGAFVHNCAIMGC